MTVSGTNFLQYVQKDKNYSNNGDNAAQVVQRAWAAGGLWVDSQSSTEQKVQAASSTITSLLSLLGSNEQGAASQEVEANDKAADSLDKSIQTTTNQTNSQVNELISKMQEVGEKIQRTLDNVNNENKEKEEYQKKLQENLKTIETCKGILENPNSTSAERTVAIEKLKTAGKGIAELSDAVEKLQNSTKEEKEEVEALSAEQTELDAGVDTTIQEGNEALKQAAVQAQAEQSKNAATAAKGTTNEATSAAAKAEAVSVRATSKGSSWIPILGAATSTGGEVVAQKLDKVAADQSQAGRTRIAGAGNTGARISASELTRQSSLTKFADLSSYALGTSGDNSNISNDFYSYIEPIGEWLENADNMDSQSEQLNSAVETASEQVERQECEDNNNGNESQGSGQNNPSVKLEFKTDELEKLSA